MMVAEVMVAVEVAATAEPHREAVAEMAAEVVATKVPAAEVVATRVPAPNVAETMVPAPDVAGMMVPAPDVVGVTAASTTMDLEFAMRAAMPMMAGREKEATATRTIGKMGIGGAPRVATTTATDAMTSVIGCGGTGPGSGCTVRTATHMATTHMATIAGGC